MSEDAIVCESISKNFILKDGAVYQALTGISFTIPKGSFVGVIGKNGCGKTTLLKILSGITKPSSGQVKIFGKALSILEVGTGFYPDMTGIENVYMVSKQFGLRNSEIDSLLPSILSFSEIGNYVYQPVKHYSQGMYLRLAISILFHLDADLYFFDEVITVGDEAFQKKCFDKIKQLTLQKKTFILVSHNIQQIEQLCDQCIELRDGKIINNGLPTDVCFAYREFVNSKRNQQIRKSAVINYIHDNCVAIEDFSMTSSPNNFEKTILTHEELNFNIRWRLLNPTFGIAFHINFYDSNGLLFLSTSNVFGKSEIELQEIKNSAKQVNNTSLSIPPFFLNEGFFLVELNTIAFMSSNDNILVAKTGQPIVFNIIDENIDFVHGYYSKVVSSIRSKLNWSRLAELS